MMRNETEFSPKILYIDDDENNMRLMKRVLEADGYQVALAANGLTGLMQANKERPDLVLLDLYMPDMNGHEVARCLRRMETTRTVPIVIVSASSSPRDKLLSIQVGCDGYITKPINVDVIASQIASFL
ncbi:MAG: response regulator [Anaerolineae bacterium]|nr:response regulator [Anaerolineae bacterium]